MLNTPDSSPRSRCKKTASTASSGTSASSPAECGSVSGGGVCPRPKLGSTSDVNSDSGSVTSVASVASATSATSANSSSPCKEKNSSASTASSNKSKTMTLGHKTKLKQIWGKVNQIARGKPGDVAGDDGGPIIAHNSAGSAGSSTLASAVNQMYHSHSNPDLTSICYEDPRADYPEHVLKVFKADQTCKYLLTNKVFNSTKSLLKKKIKKKLTKKEFIN